jgi:hypothetical protein
LPSTIRARRRPPAARAAPELRAFAHAAHAAHDVHALGVDGLLDPAVTFCDETPG